MSTVSTGAGWSPNVVARSPRRAARPESTATDTPAGGWEFGPYRLQPCGTLLGPQGVVALTPKEEGLLRVLVAAEGRRLSKEAILDAVWGGADVLDGSITRAVHTLRRRLGERPGGPVYIGTAYGRGYQLSVPVRRLD
jgi:DNA-binding winged helix-turn-helix (wHTH) protein